jgi:hypothetical protein
MKKFNVLNKIPGRILARIIYSGVILSVLFTSLFTALVRARTIDLEQVNKHLAAQSLEQIYNPQNMPQFAEQRPLQYEMGLDSRCMSWSTNPVGNGWTPENNYYVFFIDYYVPPDKKAIICTTPALATTLRYVVKKPLLYKIVPTEYGLHVRVIIGVSEAVKPCKKLTGNANCVNSILSQQATIRYEP